MNTDQTHKSDEWIPFTEHALFYGLNAGNKIRLYTGQEGVFTRFLRKNVEMIMKGKKYSVPTSAIRMYNQGNFLSETNISEMITPKRVMPLNKGLENLTKDKELIKTGDVVLLHRGSNKFDIVEVTLATVGNIHGILLNGPSAGKSYKWNTELYVQKLDPSRFK